MRPMRVACRMPTPLEFSNGPLVKRVIDECFRVYNHHGHGFFEAVYVRSLCVALTKCSLDWRREVAFPVCFDDQCVGEYRADLVVEDQLLVEAKTVEKILPAHLAQVRNYLKASALPVGLVFNFGPSPQVRRVTLVG